MHHFLLDAKEKNQGQFLKTLFELGCFRKIYLNIHKTNRVLKIRQFQKVLLIQIIKLLYYLQQKIKKLIFHM